MKTGVSTEKILKVAPISMNWQDNPAVRTLSDVVVGVMAEEYVQVARKNEGVFRDPGYFASSFAKASARQVAKFRDDKKSAGMTIKTEMTE